ncbi:hypothetical protein BH09PSE4_BH09PSE4_21400 [soil metagenome]
MRPLLPVLLLLAGCQTTVYGDRPGMASRADKPVICATAAACMGRPAIPLDTLKEVTQTLSSDAFEGRAPGTPGETKTLAYIVDRFQKAGLKPGNNGSWFQDVPLVGIAAHDVQPLTFAGGKTPVSLAYRTDMVAVTRRVVPQMNLANSDVVFVGYGINAPERGWNDYAGLDVHGKTVVILVNDPDWQTPESNGLFDGRKMT